MSPLMPTSDSDLLEMLRADGPMSVAEMAEAIEVTATAVRQRLSRLLAHGLVHREAIRRGRGRPKHRYHLTRKGLRLSGTNFADLALALWRQIASIKDPALRRELLGNVARSLAKEYAEEVHGQTTGERMHSLAELLAERQVPFSVDRLGGLPVLTARVCPYPELAEEDPGICVLEGILFSAVLRQEVKLSRCRLEGAGCCQFEPV